jgi:hypothetical protein
MGASSADEVIVAETSGAIVDDARATQPGAVSGLDGAQLHFGFLARADGIGLALDADPGAAQRRQIALLEFFVGEAGVGGGRRRRGRALLLGAENCCAGWPGWVLGSAGAWLRVCVLVSGPLNRGWNSSFSSLPRAGMRRAWREPQKAAAQECPRAAWVSSCWVRRIGAGSRFLRRWRVLCHAYIRRWSARTWNVGREAKSGWSVGQVVNAGGRSLRKLAVRLVGEQGLGLRGKRPHGA